MSLLERFDAAIAAEEERIRLDIDDARANGGAVANNHWHDLYHLQSARRIAAKLLPLITEAVREEGLGV